MRLHFFLLAIVFFVMFGSSARAEKYEVETKQDVPYGKGGDVELMLDLAKPKNAEGKLPAIVFIHGGGWRGGYRGLYADVIKQVAAEGYVVLTISYRFAPQHKFPAQIEDCKCAVRWLRAHADELGVDPNRIGAIGHSAGAHLSMLLGTMDKQDGLEGEGGWPDQSSKVQAVVAFFGPTTLQEDIPDVTIGMVEDFVGGKLAEHQEMARKASPVAYVDSSDAPTLIFQGTDDPLVPWSHAVRMAEALTKAKVPGRVELLLGLGHGWGEKSNARTHAATMEFFRLALRNEAAQ